MNIYKRKILIKILLFGVLAPLIIITSQRYTQSLVNRLKADERNKVELWARATERLVNTDGSADEDLSLIATIIENNTSVPVILADEKGQIISSVNFRKTSKIKDPAFLHKELGKMMERREPIVIDLGEGHFNYLYYKDSLILSKVRYYPWVQLTVILFFGIISYMAFSSSRRAEENQVWVGMSKETAHQLGTPVSSLSAWLEMLREKYSEETLTTEMQKDISRLEKITQRFSGIGAKPEHQLLDLYEVIFNTVNYLKPRTSSKVTYDIKIRKPGVKVMAEINIELFEWVIENLCKNAIDAMEGAGEITISLTTNQKTTIIDFEDTGKGIPRRSFSTVFRPGFTTKRTGWGLGLSLAKRIIEQYHNGKIFVHSSEPGKGTIIRILLMGSYVIPA